MITRGVFERVFRIGFRDGQATCFAIEDSERQYLVTAAHVVEGINEDDEINVWRQSGWYPLQVRVVGLDKSHDVAVLAHSQQICPAYGVIPTQQDLTTGQDAFFLGFPYGLLVEPKPINKFDNGGFPIALVKKACVSALTMGSHDSDFLLDGHNNTGFSGGPVVFDRPNRIPQLVPGTIVQVELRVAGVISSYVEVDHPVMMGGKPLKATVDYNTGIIKCASIGHALRLVRQNPIGAPISLSGSTFEHEDIARKAESERRRRERGET